MSEAIAMYVQSNNRLPLKKICQLIGEKYSTRGETVFRAISYAIKTTPDIRENLSALSGITVRKEDMRPKYVVCLIAHCIELELLK